MKSCDRFVRRNLNAHSGRNGLVWFHTVDLFVSAVPNTVSFKASIDDRSYDKHFRLYGARRVLLFTYRGEEGKGNCSMSRMCNHGKSSSSASIEWQRCDWLYSVSRWAFRRWRPRHSSIRLPHRHRRFLKTFHTSTLQYNLWIVSNMLQLD